MQTKDGMEAIADIHKGGHKDRTNHYMYGEIWTQYQADRDLSFEAIDKTFSLANRTDMDLKNLIEYVVAITIMCGQDVLKAQLNDKQREQAEIEKHKDRCALMSILISAIESELSSR
jgi:hypothetical protein